MLVSWFIGRFCLFGLCEWGGMLICPASVLCILGPDLENALGKGLGVDLGLF